MLLVIDCGNTNTVVSIFENSAKVDALVVWRMATDPEKTADDHAAWLSYHMKRGGFSSENIKAVVLGSVVPMGVKVFKQLAEKHLGVEAFVIDSSVASDEVIIRIDDPKQAGSDRIANAVAAREYGLPGLVIDFGTATTFDLVDKDGAYIGGAIAPGVNLSIEALERAAARLPLIDPDTWHIDMPIIGANTVDAMNSGLFHGYLNLTRGMIESLEQAAGSKLTVITTGGLGALFTKAMPKGVIYDPELTLKGMVRIYQSRKR